MINTMINNDEQIMINNDKHIMINNDEPIRIKKLLFFVSERSINPFKKIIFTIPCKSWFKKYLYYYLQLLVNQKSILYKYHRIFK